MNLGEQAFATLRVFLKDLALDGVEVERVPEADKTVGDEYHTLVFHGFELRRGACRCGVVVPCFIRYKGASEIIVQGSVLDQPRAVELARRLLTEHD
jgi:hypothetical protein